MNLSEARDELRARGFDGLTDARCTAFLNAGKNVLENYAPWPWLDASTSGTSPITISDLKTVLHVWSTSPNTSLEGQDRNYLRSTYGPDLTLTGGAQFWYLDGLSTMRFFPVDTVTRNVDYLKVSPELSADADEPLFPARLHPVWIDFAVVEAYVDADEPTMAQSVQAKAENRLARELDTYFNRNLQNPGKQLLTFSSQDS